MIRPDKIIVGLVLIIMFSAGISARHSGDYLNAVTTDLKTPVSFALKPYSQGKLRALFITPLAWAPRDIVELWQRFDIDFEAFVLTRSNLLEFALYSQGTSPEEKEAELLEKLEKEYDVIVFGRAVLAALPDVAIYKILRKTAEGKVNIVFFDTRKDARQGDKFKLFETPLNEDVSSVTEGVPFAGLDSFKTDRFNKGFIAVYKYGKGKIGYVDLSVCRQWAEFGYPGFKLQDNDAGWAGRPAITPSEPYSKESEVRYEYYLSLVQKIALFASGKSPEINIQTSSFDGRKIQRNDLPAKNMELPIISGQSIDEKSFNIHCRISSLFGDRIPQNAGFVKKENKTCLVFNIPDLPSGGYYYDFFIRNKKGEYVTWSSFYFSIEDPAGIIDVKIQDEVISPDRKTIKFSLELGAEPKKNSLIRTSIIDTEGRLVFKQDTPIKGTDKNIPIEFSPPPMLCRAGYLRTEYLVEDKVNSIKEKILYFPSRDFKGKFPVIPFASPPMWNFDISKKLVCDLLRKETGLTMVMGNWGYGNNTNNWYYKNCLLTDLPPMLYSTRLHFIADERGWTYNYPKKSDEDASPNIPGYWDKIEKEYAEYVKTAKPYLVGAYTLGDESNFSPNMGYSPSDKRAFREFIRPRYNNDLKKLNACWAKNFKSWDEVEPVPVKEALETKNYPARHDQLAFAEWIYAWSHHKFAEIIAKLDPAAPVGSEHSPAGDVELTTSKLGLWSFPPGQIDDFWLLASLHPGPDFYRFMWWGGYTGQGKRFDPKMMWKNLVLYYQNACGFYTLNETEGMLRGDLSFCRDFQKLLPELKEVISGIGQLVSTADYFPDPIAIHYSRDSAHLSAMFLPFESPDFLQHALVHTLWELGFNARLITTKQILENGLDPRKYKIFFMLSSMSIGKEEAQKIKEYVTQGGIVIADAVPGIADEHCWLKGGGNLDDLFGIKREKADKSAPGRIEIKGRFLGQDISLTADRVSADRGVTNISGEVLGKDADIPCFISRKTGKGAAVLLNFDIFTASHFSTSEADWSGFVSSLLKSSGIEQEYFLKCAQDDFILRVFKRGKVKILVLVRNKECPNSGTVKLAKESFVYDVRKKKFSGKATEIPLSAESPYVQIYSVLDAEAQPVDIIFPPKISSGEKIPFRLKSETDNQGHLYRVEVYKPDNSEYWQYRQYISSENPNSDMYFALNDPGGKWKITVEDIVTGLKSQVEFELK